MDDSSPDLSLKLRRGSSDSRDSFYMDLDKGIDSDIEEIATCSTVDHGDTTADNTTITPTVLAVIKEERVSWPTIPPQNVSGDSRSSALGGVDPLLPSPASHSAVIVSPETLSHHSSPAKIPSVTTASVSTVKQGPAHVQISSTQRSYQSTHLALAPIGYHYGYPPNFPVIRKQSIAEKQMTWRQLGADALATTLSALYGKLLVVMGTAFPMAEVLSTYIPPSFYEVYYLYLYIGSMCFMLYLYTMLLRDKRKRKKEEADLSSQKSIKGSSISDSGEESDRESEETSAASTSSNVCRPTRKGSLLAQVPKQYHYGSFYLRIGAVAFGIGSMIYSGLEFGQYFELERNTKCHNVLLALTPATRMAFIFIQMYFIFLNNEQMKIYKHKLAARFGLMHMIGTNLSVWLNVLVQETKHEILTFYNPENNSLRISHRLAFKNNIFQFPHMSQPDNVTDNNKHHIVARGLKGPHRIYECRRTNVLGTLVQDASPFLFPCTIEYSLICAAILYVMWKSISKLPIPNMNGEKKKLEHAYRRSPHHYSVDCARAHKGLFVGILLLVMTIISLILFFVLISRQEFAAVALIEVNICELTLYGMAFLATLIGMWQIRQLKYDGSRNLQLDNILLVGAQTGMFIYSMFTIIGGQFTIEKNTILTLITALASVLQTTCQTIFILDASRRSCVTPDQIRKKPGREIVTFLLVTNLAMWALNTLEKSRADSHPIQLHFYGLWAWTIITHVSMPLAIFYRFHSTVCLCEIWKRAYKIKPTYM
ncbi:proton channel OtopLc-like [Agrilus planipennis]|uniref:Proton channel OtopLc-like n=2 Tax=Agrilus planipennis TaxID=224129 RepID=A0A7F5QZV8_AGRPL|nr:proton channel OtopLc-like [Agrilus planipennis]